MCYPKMTDNMLTLCIGMTRAKVRSISTSEASVTDQAILGFLLEEEAKRASEFKAPEIVNVTPINSHEELHAFFGGRD